MKVLSLCFLPKALLCFSPLRLDALWKNRCEMLPFSLALCPRILEICPQDREGHPRHTRPYRQC